MRNHPTRARTGKASKVRRTAPKTKEASRKCQVTCPWEEKWRADSTPVLDVNQQP